MSVEVRRGLCGVRLISEDTEKTGLDRSRARSEHSEGTEMYKERVPRTL